MTRQTRQSLRARSGHGQAGGVVRKLKGIARRLRVGASEGATWIVDGHSDGLGNTETDTVENFEGIGFASRPLATDNAEVITIKVGGDTEHPVIVAGRARDVFKVLEDDEGLEKGEVAIFNRNSMIKIKADGTIELGSIGGTRKRLATIDDIDALAAMVSSHIHVTTATIGSGPGVGVLSPPSPSAPSAVGTTKVEAE